MQAAGRPLFGGPKLVDVGGDGERFAAGDCGGCFGQNGFFAKLMKGQELFGKWGLESGSGAGTLLGRAANANSKLVCNDIREAL